MNKQTQAKPKQAAQSRKRTRQASVGGILLTLLLAAITWWNGGGAKPSAPSNVATMTPQATLAMVLQNVQPTAKPTKKAAPPAGQATKVPATKVVTPAAVRTKVPTSTPKAAKLATATPRPTQTPAKAPPTKAPPTATPKPPPRTGVSGLPTVLYRQLPGEAQHTVDLIEQGGPFPYDRDGIVFQNREEILPRRARGYYHEYTVMTPGESDRGARRIITGDKGEMFYTDDHYASFQEVVR